MHSEPLVFLDHGEKGQSIGAPSCLYARCNGFLSGTDRRVAVVAGELGFLRSALVSVAVGSVTGVLPSHIARATIDSRLNFYSFRPCL